MKGGDVVERRIDWVDPSLERMLEAYVGEYASGKSEVAVNRALALAGRGREVTIVDMDVVEPFYTLRPLKKELTARGLHVIAWETHEVIGLGEAGSVIHPDVVTAMARKGDLIFDIGYGTHGAGILKLVQGALEHPDLRIYLVVNIARPFTSTAELIVEYIRTFARIDGLINNSHLGEETDVDLVQKGARVVAQAAKLSGLRVIATTALERLAREIGDHDAEGNPVWPITRYMEKAVW